MPRTPAANVRPIRVYPHRVRHTRRLAILIASQILGRIKIPEFRIIGEHHRCGPQGSSRPPQGSLASTETRFQQKQNFGIPKGHVPLRGIMDNGNSHISVCRQVLFEHVQDGPRIEVGKITCHQRERRPRRASHRRNERTKRAFARILVEHVLNDSIRPDRRLG